ncbi:restriction endonuclease FokI C-terminal domain-containing protein [uncultured Draconibacterium sp.]|uniref:restriction endonuclease FokI C-terminal domain-containing protein n=1 Tax=uncultured Draconibacterium sp. TaxID=1573823 RepID=UPI002AA72D83|nr:restriction endonuclease FokI C-terminal domain-containing protein [uncultured Draconibacterium sp.]
MIPKDKIEKVKEIWDEYIKSDQIVLDTKGNELPNIDELRLEAIESLSDIILQFKKKELSVGEFKTSIDSFNKRNNLWGFTAIKGQFFFNQLTKNLDDSGIKKLQDLLIQTISEPKNISEALAKIELLEKYCQNLYDKAKDKRLVPNPKSVCYFLSYFWQVADNEKWAIYYTASIQALDDIGLWKEKPLQRENYEQYYLLNEEIKNILKEYSKKAVSNWDVEHAFWHFRGNPNKKTEKKTKTIIIEKPEEKEEKTNLIVNASFDLTDYIIPRVSKLVELGSSTEKSATKKGYEFEKIVAEVFEQLDFEVETLGQGTGRNPDAILRFREENTAFIVDAKAYNSGYSLGTDDRAIREYINYYCPKLIKSGYKKIGFIIVSNEFKSNFDNFINEITWDTDIKRFILLTSEALLYLLAFKTKNKLSLANIIESIIGFGNPVTAKNIIDEFDDV